jgi:hypothetical protein
MTWYASDGRVLKRVDNFAVAVHLVPEPPVHGVPPRRAP